MAGTMDILVREMTMEDYDQVYKLWTKISGFRITVSYTHLDVYKRQAEEAEQLLLSRSLW